MDLRNGPYRALTEQVPGPLRRPPGNPPTRHVRSPASAGLLSRLGQSLKMTFTTRLPFKVATHSAKSPSAPSRCISSRAETSPADTSNSMVTIFLLTVSPFAPWIASGRCVSAGKGGGQGRGSAPDREVCPRKSFDVDPDGTFPSWVATEERPEDRAWRTKVGMTALGLNCSVAPSPVSY